MMQKTDAIVLRVVDFSETSCIVTMFTRDHGKIGAIAKGARRLKSPFENSIDLLARCSVVFIQKNSDALDILTESKLQRRFKSSSRDLNRFYAALYVAEITNALTDAADPAPDLFDLLDATLQNLDGQTAVVPTIITFQMQALELLGHCPVLDHCTECGLELESFAAAESGEKSPAKPVLFLGLQSGGLLCETCRRNQRAVQRLSPPGLRILRNALEPSTRPLDSPGPENLPGNLQRHAIAEAFAVARNYIVHLLGFQPRLHSAIEKLH